MAEEYVFNVDGTYTEVAYSGKMKTTGQWFLNEDQTKMEFMISSFNGQQIPPFPETTRHFNKIILKLTKDTLIYGNEAYYGEKKIYGHDDLYFVRKDQ